MTFRGLDKKTYTIVVHSESVIKAQKYQQEIADGEKKPGAYFSDVLKDKYRERHSFADDSQISDQSVRTFVNSLAIEEFYQLLFNTKKTVISAERELRADNTDWAFDEVALLAEIATVADVEIYAHGKRDERVCRGESLYGDGTIVIVPGLLLTTLKGTNPDRESVVFESTVDRNQLMLTKNLHGAPVFQGFETTVELINFNKFYDAYKLRMLPALAMINQKAQAEEDKKLILTLPNICTGLFQGDFDVNYLKSMLAAAVRKMIQEYPNDFSQFEAVYLDLHEHDNRTPETITINNRVLRLYNLHTKNNNKEMQLLVHPATFDSQYKDCGLVNIVAGNPVSLPGNEGLAGQEESDEATVALCTNLPAVMTGTNGYFAAYDSPEKYKPHTADTFAETLKDSKARQQVIDRANWQRAAESLLVEMRRTVNTITIFPLSGANSGCKRASRGQSESKDEYTSAEALQLIQLYSKFDTTVKLTADNKLPPVVAKADDGRSYSLTPSSRAFLNSITQRVKNIKTAKEDALKWCGRNYKKDNAAAFAKKLSEFADRQESKGENSNDIQTFVSVMMGYYEKSNPALADQIASLNEPFAFVKKILAFFQRNPGVVQRYNKLTPELKLDFIKYLKDNQDHLADTAKTSFDHFLKTKIAAEIRKYNNRCCKFSFFGHHHTKRAAVVANAILTAKDSGKVAEILQNQHDLFQKDSDTVQGTDALDERYSDSDNLKNTKKGGYYAAVTSAMRMINKFSTEAKELVHINEASTPVMRK